MHCFNYQIVNIIYGYDLVKLYFNKYNIFYLVINGYDLYLYQKYRNHSCFVKIGNASYEKNIIFLSFFTNEY